MEKPLIILEMANNHMGDLSHGKKIILEFNKLTKNYKKKINFAFKFQYRDSETFIHDSFKNSDHKGVKRFETTFFSYKQWKNLISFAGKYYDLICTPFDEVSVKKVFKEKFKYLKIASCSATDWPLLEEISNFHKKKKKKIIASLAGLESNEISKVISFFKNRNIDTKFLYCVGKYPTKYNELNLSFFKYLKDRYGEVIQGFSSHEEPNSYITPILAYGTGVRIFEKHVGLETSKYKLNKYSLSKKNLNLWLDNLVKSIDIWGSNISRNKSLNEEIMQLNNFKRGIYLCKNANKDESILKNNIKIAYPSLKNQLKENDLSKYSKIILKQNLSKGKPILYSNIKITDERTKISKIRDKVKNFLSNKNVVIPKNSRLEVSHHYGIDKFYNYGITMINVINSKYCKKLIILLPGQVHPTQYHKIKEESFFMLHGEVNLILNNKKFILKEGMLKTIKPKIKHKFYSKKGCIIEELSTTSKKNDSFYLDKKIHLNKNRKSFISLY